MIQEKIEIHNTPEQSSFQQMGDVYSTDSEANLPLFLTEDILECRELQSKNKYSGYKLLEADDVSGEPLVSATVMTVFQYDTENTKRPTKVTLTSRNNQSLEFIHNRVTPHQTAQKRVTQLIPTAMKSVFRVAGTPKRTRTVKSLSKNVCLGCAMTKQRVCHNFHWANAAICISIVRTMRYSN